MPLASITLKELAARATRCAEESKQLQEDLKAFTQNPCSPDDFRGIDAAAFQDLNDVLRKALDFDAFCDKSSEWETCYDEAQLHEPDQLSKLLDTATLSKKHATLKKVPLLSLLRENPKAEWCEVVSRLGNLFWTAAQIAQFPIALCRAYISNIRPDDSRREPRRCDRDGDTLPSQPIWLSLPETLLCHLLHSFYHLLTKEERVEAAKAIDKCSVRSCPLGARVRLFSNNSSSDTEIGRGRMDLVRHILKQYHNDPLSLTCTDFRTLTFCGSRYIERYGFVRPGECSHWNKVTYYFPDLCYVFPTKVKVTYHHERFASTIPDFEQKKTEVTVKTNPERRVPFISSYDKSTAAKQKQRSFCCAADNELEEKTIMLEGSVCKSLRIDVPTGCYIHDVKIFGDMLLLF